jgi:hypothetical protein
MKIVYIKVTFKDLFSGATMVKPTMKRRYIYQNEKSIGQVVERFEDNIHFSRRLNKFKLKIMKLKLNTSF